MNVASSFLINDVIPAIDVKRLAGNETRRIVGQEGRSDTDVVDADKTARRRFGLRPVE